jgi:hypothetical protein
VIVGVKPFDHLQARHIDAILLVTTAHGEVLVNAVQAGAGIPLGNGAKVLDVRENLVVESKVIAGNDVDTGVLLDLPVSKSEPLGLGEQVGLRELAAPV